MKSDAPWIRNASGVALKEARQAAEKSSLRSISRDFLFRMPGGLDARSTGSFGRPLRAAARPASADPGRRHGARENAKVGGQFLGEFQTITEIAPAEAASPE